MHRAKRISSFNVWDEEKTSHRRLLKNFRFFKEQQLWKIFRQMFTKFWAALVKNAFRIFLEIFSLS